MGHPGGSRDRSRAGRLTHRRIGRTVESVTASDRCAAPIGRSRTLAPAERPLRDPPSAVHRQLRVLDVTFPVTDTTDTRSSLIRIAFASTYPPRRCGIATFTSDLSRRGGRPRDRRPHAARSRRSPIPPRSTTGSGAITGRTTRRWPAPSTAAGSRPSRSSTSTGSGVAPTASTCSTSLSALRVPTDRDPPHGAPPADRAPAPRPRGPRRGDRCDRGDVAGRRRPPARRLRDRSDAGSTSSPTASPSCRWSSPTRSRPRSGSRAARSSSASGSSGPGKGYELAIEAMAEVKAAHPNARYVILGATHPDLIRTEGEAYRNRLVARVAELGLTEHVVFVDRFVGRRELARWLEAADIFVTPYPNLEQIVSGTLSYAMSAGKAIVSTPVRLRGRAAGRRPRRARRARLGGRAGPGLRRAPRRPGPAAGDRLRGRTSTVAG